MKKGGRPGAGQPQKESEAGAAFLIISRWRRFFCRGMSPKMGYAKIGKKQDSYFRPTTGCIGQKCVLFKIVKKICLLDFWATAQIPHYKSQKASDL